jgi:pyridoxal phosphate enzyme (YggS family)
MSSGSDVASATPTIDVAGNLQDVRDRIQAACERCHRSPDTVKLVAVSKTKPPQLLQQAYDAGQRVFGENYVQELIEKVPQLPEDVTWHFIGPLQSNKANKLVQAFEPTHLNRLVIETIAGEKLASKLNSAVPDNQNSGLQPAQIQVMVQVNTSGEDSKSGVEPSQVVELCRHIVQNCPKLRLRGVMTIGAEDNLACFDILVQCRDQVVASLEHIDEAAAAEARGVSMGMSGDFEEAIERGATSVRVGSTIFGQRTYTK